VEEGTIVDLKDLKFKLEVAEDGYQLVCGDEESGVADYGDEATVEVEGVTYGIVVEDAADAKTALVYQYLDDVTPEVEETEFDLDGDSDGVEDEDDDDDDDDEETPA
jgi:hypothetical protein